MVTPRAHKAAPRAARPQSAERYCLATTHHPRLAIGGTASMTASGLEVMSADTKTVQCLSLEWSRLKGRYRTFA